MTIVLIRAIIIYIAVIAAVRVMGKRQIGELKPHELVITILISSVATIPIQDNAIPLANSIIPILVFTALEIIESAISMKSLKFRNIVQGKPVFIIKNGKLIQSQLKRLRFTMDDLIDALRQGGAFDIANVENAVVETNGSLSIQLKSEKSPATPSDLKINCEKSSLPIVIVMDGKPINEYYTYEKIDSGKINMIVNASGVDISDIMLMTIDGAGKINIIKKDE